MAEIKSTAPIEKIPYNEDGLLLSFKTLADTVYVGTQTLKEYLDDLVKNLKGEAGKSGDLISIETKYAVVSDANNNYTSVSQLDSSFWKTTSPSITKATPHLWKKITISYKNTDSSGKETVRTETSYEYCGTQGAPGIDAEWREWIFKIAPEDNETKALLINELLACYKNEDFLTNDYVPSGWSDDMQEVKDSTKVLWCTSRDKINGVWSRFKSPHIFGRKAIDGTLSNNIYTIADEIDEDLWNTVIKKSLINSIKYKEGKITNIPTFSPKWYDSCPNANSNEIVWQATCYFTNKQCINIDYPVRITGPQGAGTDGAGLEFAYCLSQTNDIPSAIVGSEKHFEGNGIWKDLASECSINETYPYLFASRRLGQYTNDTNWYWMYEGVKYGISDLEDVYPVNLAPSDWNYGWSTPMLWSSWGQDGIDGDGVQYVFLRLTLLEYDWITKYGWSDFTEKASNNNSGSSSSSGGTSSGDQSDSQETTYVLKISEVSGLLFYEDSTKVTYKILDLSTKRTVYRSEKSFGIDDGITVNLDSTSKSWEKTITCDYNGTTYTTDVTITRLPSDSENIIYIIYNSGSPSSVSFTTKEQLENTGIQTTFKGSEVKAIIVSQYLNVLIINMNQSGQNDWYEAGEGTLLKMYKPNADIDSEATYKVNINNG